MYQAPRPPAPAPKKYTGLIIGIVALTVIAMLGLGVYTFIGMKRAFTELAAPSDAGPDMSQEEIKALLAGPKHDFVGRWENPQGALAISEDGRIGYGMQVGLGHENANGHISVFRDNAFYVMSLRFEIDEAPRKVGEKWRMKVRGHTFIRD